MLLKGKRINLTQFKLIAFLIIIPFFSSCLGVEKNGLKAGNTINKTVLEPTETLRSNDQSWTMALIPDVQTYVKIEDNQRRYYQMMDWIVNHREDLDISLTLFVGDLVEHNNRKNLPTSGPDQTSTQQWDSFQKGIQKLMPVMPVIVCAGNHDMGFSSAENRNSQLGNYVKPSDSAFIDPQKGGILKSMWKDPINGETVQNAFYQWKAPDGRDFHILSLEFNPRRAAMQWGLEQLAPMSADSVGIYLTHSFLSSMTLGSYPMLPEGYGIAANSTSGRKQWRNMIGTGDSIDMIFCGHVATNESIDGMIGFRQDANMSGKTVTQMMFNAQRIGGWNGNGGDGWFRLLEFLPDGKTVIVRTYSSWFEANPELGDKQRVSEWDFFSFQLD